MRRSVVAGNWKMNGTREAIERLLAEMLPGAGNGIVAETIVCPPYGYLDTVGRAIEGSPVKLGAQNVSEHAEGAYTGEMAPGMLRDLGCSYVIVGHSERRTLYGEVSTLVARKFEAAKAAGLTPILCVGETLEEREQGTTQAVIAEQLDCVLDGAGLDGALVAYEPVWAIGTGRTASPEQAQEIHDFIRSRVAGRDPVTAGNLPILYGGSVKPSNAAELFGMADIDGGLIGGASLKAEDFLQICRAAG